MTGRPSTYGEAVIEAAKEYLENYGETGDRIPSVEGLCCHINRARSTVYKWAGEEGKEAFSDILENINERQALVLINKGLSGEYNSNIVKLVLGKHGYHDKQDTKIDMNVDLKSLSIEDLERIANGGTPTV